MQKSVTTYYADIAKNFPKDRKIVLRNECVSDFRKPIQICGQLFENGLSPSLIEQEYQFEQESVFCVIFNFGNSLGWHLFNALSKDCVPVVFSDKYILPFSDVLDWNRCIITLHQYQVADLSRIIASMPSESIEYRRRHCSFYFTTYMSTMDRIVDTALAIVEARFDPIRAKSYYWWNEPEYDYIRSSVRRWICGVWLVDLSGCAHSRTMWRIWFPGRSLRWRISEI